MTSPVHGPRLSVVVVAYNIPQQIRRTLLSLSAGYQRGIASADYEVLVVDNGSKPALDAGVFEGLEGNFRLLRMDPAPPSPAHAANAGLAEAKGDVICLMIDGARMATPGLLRFGLEGALTHQGAVTAALGWYLGFDLQKYAIAAGHDAAREDELLASIDWPGDGYRLFEISTPDESSTDGWFQRITEANALFLRRAQWDALGGVDERFDVPGGGLINPDTFRRAMELPGSRLVTLLGEATFHQAHGGIATNSRYEDFSTLVAGWLAQYESLRGKPWAAPDQPDRIYLGSMPEAAKGHFARSLLEPVFGLRPPGLPFELNLDVQPALVPSDPAIAPIVDLAHAEFRARRFQAAAEIARLGLARAPREPSLERLLVHAGPSLRRRPEELPWPAAYQAALGQAYRALGDNEAAAAAFRAALAQDPDVPAAHVGLSHIRLPGEGYHAWLSRLHGLLKPDVYLEIGFHRGYSLALARPPTHAIGVDPAAELAVQFRTTTTIHAETSDEFFASRKLDAVLAGRHLRMAFIDGLHLFEQTLRDFANVEPYCGPGSVVVFHDTLPLDEATQARERRTVFHTGDVWKVIPALKTYRPDLDIFTIATPWSGLSIVTGFGGTEHRLADHYDKAVAELLALPFAEVAASLTERQNVVANDPEIVLARLRRAGVLAD